MENYMTLMCKRSTQVTVQSEPVPAKLADKIWRGEFVDVCRSTGANAGSARTRRRGMEQWVVSYIRETCWDTCPWS